MSEIKLTQGYIAIVDDEDFEELNQYSWSILKSPNTMYANRYYSLGSKRVTQRMHRFILDAPSGVMVDHINQNGLDNRRCNIRLCNRMQNGWNRKISKNNKSGYKGVAFHKIDKRYRSSIMANGKAYVLGNFKCKHEAAKAYNKKAIELYGEFARLNIIKPEKEEA